jgi:folate-binding Fe-S cluster repair protein YgfZ
MTVTGVVRRRIATLRIDTDIAVDHHQAPFLPGKTQWRGLPAGALLHGDGLSLAVVTHAEDDAAAGRAQVMLAFLHLLMAKPSQRVRSDPDCEA